MFIVRKPYNWDRSNSEAESSDGEVSLGQSSDAKESNSEVEDADGEEDEAEDLDLVIGSVEQVNFVKYPWNFILVMCMDPVHVGRMNSSRRMMVMMH